MVLPVRTLAGVLAARALLGRGPRLSVLVPPGAGGVVPVMAGGLGSRGAVARHGSRRPGPGAEEEEECLEVGEPPL